MHNNHSHHPSTPSSAEHTKQKGIFLAIIGLHLAFGVAIAGLLGADAAFIGMGVHVFLMIAAILGAVLGVQLKMPVLLYGYASIAFIWFAYSLIHILLLLRIVSFLDGAGSTKNLMVGNKVVEYHAALAGGGSVAEPVVYSVQLGIVGGNMFVVAVGLVCSVFMRYLTDDLPESFNMERSLPLSDYSSAVSKMNDSNPRPSLSNDWNQPQPSKPWTPPSDNLYYTDETKGFGPQSLSRTRIDTTDRRQHQRDTQWGNQSVASSTMPRSTAAVPVADNYYGSRGRSEDSGRREGYERDRGGRSGDGNPYYASRGRSEDGVQNTAPYYGSRGRGEDASSTPYYSSRGRSEDAPATPYYASRGKSEDAPTTPYYASRVKNDETSYNASRRKSEDAPPPHPASRQTPTSHYTTRGKSEDLQTPTQNPTPYSTRSKSEDTPRHPTTDNRTTLDDITSAYGYGSLGRPEHRATPPTSLTKKPPKEPKVRCRTCGEKMALSASGNHFCPSSPSEVAGGGGSTLERKAGGERVKVVKRYNPMLEDEIGLEVDDVVEVGEVFEDGWGNGVNVSTGEFGAFPLSCLGGIGTQRKTMKRVQSIYGAVGRQSSSASDGGGGASTVSNEFGRR
ncbi:hypothetical protein HDU67_010043 [Dinochytrium kinnereticum]|nr:hypothetical protein HDU67_010043 [Dinochytrium kinnereticum]